MTQYIHYLNINFRNLIIFLNYVKMNKIQIIILPINSLKTNKKFNFQNFKFILLLNFSLNYEIMIFCFKYFGQFLTEN